MSRRSCRPKLECTCLPACLLKPKIVGMLSSSLSLLAQLNVCGIFSLRTSTAFRPTGLAPSGGVQFRGLSLIRLRAVRGVCFHPPIVRLATAADDPIVDFCTFLPYTFSPNGNTVHRECTRSLLASGELRCLVTHRRSMCSYLELSTRLEDLHSWFIGGGSLVCWWRGGRSFTFSAVFP